MIVNDCNTYASIMWQCNVSMYSRANLTINWIRKVLIMNYSLIANNKNEIHEQVPYIDESLLQRTMTKDFQHGPYVQMCFVKVKYKNYLIVTSAT